MNETTAITIIAKEVKKKCNVSSNKQEVKKKSNKIHFERELTQWWEMWGYTHCFTLGHKFRKVALWTLHTPAQIPES